MSDELKLIRFKPAHNSTKAQLSIDGIVIDGVSSVVVTTRPDNLVTMTITLIDFSVDKLETIDKELNV